MTVLGLHHVQLAWPAGREDDMRDYFTGVLGLPELPKPEKLRVKGGCWFSLGAQELHVGVEEPFSPALKAHPCLLVDDLDATAETVRAAGGEVRFDHDIAGVRRFHTDDPVGNRIEIQQA